MCSANAWPSKSGKPLRETHAVKIAACHNKIVRGRCGITTDAALRLARYLGWNAVATGPKKNIAQTFRDAALRQGLRFGVGQHLNGSHEWTATCFGSDKTGTGPP